MKTHLIQVSIARKSTQIKVYPSSVFLVSYFLMQSSLLVSEQTNSYEYCEAEIPKSSSYQPHPTHTLRNIHVVVRHGDRTPINTLPFEGSVAWHCNVANRRAVGDGHISAMLYNEAAYFIPESDHPYTRNFWRGNCTTGELTERGFKQLRTLGESLRGIYIDSLALVSHLLQPREVLLRSTDLPRTRQSAQALLLGLFPAHFRPEGTIVQHWRKPIEIEDMMANYNKCPRYGERKAELQDLKEYRDRMDTLKPLRVKLRYYIGTDEGNTGEEFHMDPLMCRACHGKVLPCVEDSSPQVPQSDCMPDELVGQVMDQSDWSYNFLYSDEELPALAVGSFLWSLTTTMQQSLASPGAMHTEGVGGEGPYKLGVFGGHDTTIAPLIAAITGGLPDQRWPAYASSVILELWAPEGWNGEEVEENDLEGPVVRVLYNGEAVKVKGTGGSEPWCPFSHWLALVAEFSPEFMGEKCQKIPVKEVPGVNQIMFLVQKGVSWPGIVWIIGMFLVAILIAYVSSKGSQRNEKKTKLSSPTRSASGSFRKHVHQ